MNFCLKGTGADPRLCEKEPALRVNKKHKHFPAAKLKRETSVPGFYLHRKINIKIVCEKGV